MRTRNMRSHGLRFLGSCLFIAGVATPADVCFAQDGGLGEATDAIDWDYAYESSLADAPWMLGDFFGRRATQATVGTLYGQAVHHTIASGSSFADDDLHLIDATSASPKVIWVGGPAGLVPGSYLLPSQSPPLPDVVTGLSANGVPGKEFTAVATGEFTDVYDNGVDPTAAISAAQIYNVFQISTIFLPGPNVGDLVGRVRLLDNNMALPRDRVFFDYNFFHNVPLTANGIDVNRFEPGFEKTFWQGQGSVEVRVPMAITLNGNLAVDAPIDTSHYELGNMVIAPKLLLASNENMALAAGFGVAIPTADDLVVADSSGNELVQISNDAAHLIPYLAFLYAPRNSSIYAHSFLGLDIDANGNSVSANTTGDGLGLIGVWNDQQLLTASAAVGSWVYQGGSRDYVTAIALTTEMHYTATVNGADSVRSGAFIIGDSEADLSLLNGTAGAHVRLNDAIITLGYSFPITSDDRVFDGQFRTFINRFF